MRAHRLLPLLLVIALSGPARAAQVVAMDVEATGKVSPALAAALTPYFIQELSRREGISVVSIYELRALLEHESNKQALDCSDTQCMTELAGALGAELLLTTSLSRVKKTWSVNLSLIDVQRAKVVRRASGDEAGDDGAAKVAIEKAIENLFRDGVPASLQGPGSMSKRGFQAVLLGFGKVIVDPKGDPASLRRRLILDLLNTELDFDVQPKMQALDSAWRRGIGEMENAILLCKNTAERKRLLYARAYWLALRDDQARVDEIRKRARERGVRPNSGLLRFEPPEMPDEPDAESLSRAQKELEPARKVVAEALAAFEKKQADAFVALWLPKYAGNARRKFDNESRYAERDALRWEMLPWHAIVPWDQQGVIDSLEKDKRAQIFLRKFKKGKIYGDDRMWLEKDGDAWRIKSW